MDKFLLRVFVSAIVVSFLVTSGAAWGQALLPSSGSETDEAIDEDEMGLEDEDDEDYDDEDEDED